MKKIITLLAVLTIGCLNAQVFKGKGDTKLQIGASLQSGANGIHVSTDFGLGENMSAGLSSTFILGVSEGEVKDVDFEDRFDLRARFNANIGNVINLDDKLDVYPGLSLGLKNFGAHLGLRYFFSDGFGVYLEGGAPIAKYKNDSNKANNQFMTNLGVSFNL